jgi:hypothetical protein
MIRKTLIAAAAVATLALGMGAAVSTAEAGYYAKPAYTDSYEPVGYYYHKHCKWVKVWYHGYWKNVKKCWNHKHYDSYKSY